MKSILSELIQVEKDKVYLILNKVVKLGTEVQIKIWGEDKVLSATFKKIGSSKFYYIMTRSSLLENKHEATIKIILLNKLFFLKTDIKKFDESYYFEKYDNFFELVRRKTPRLQIPHHWPQFAIIRAVENKNALKSVAKIIEMSKSGIKLVVGPELPRYEKNQMIKLKFKIFRRGEIELYAKIIHHKNNPEGGPTLGAQFVDDSILIKNKIQNICDDLAFYYASTLEV